MSNKTLKEELKDDVLLRLGAGMVRVELSPDQVERCVEWAFDTYRQRAENANEEAFVMLELQKGQNEYTLPTNVQYVRKLYRRGNGIAGGSGHTVDPFSLAYSNTYLLSAVRGSAGGGLLTYDLYHQFDETVGRMFGREINFTFNTATKKLTIMRDPRTDEGVLMQVYHYKPDELLLQEPMIRPWIRDWAIAEAKGVLGANRGKLGSIIGPQGGTTLDGDTLRTESQNEKERLLEELRRYVTGSKPLGFFFG